MYGLSRTARNAKVENILNEKHIFHSVFLTHNAQVEKQTPNTLDQYVKYERTDALSLWHQQ